MLRMNLRLFENRPETVTFTAGTRALIHMNVCAVSGEMKYL